MSIKIKGLDKLQRELREIQRKVEKVSGERTVSISEVLTQTFMERFTRFSSADDMFEQSGYKVETSEDFAAIPAGDWDLFVSANTQFLNWQDMINAAGTEYISREIDL